jgi:hypothetical protein
MLGVSVGIDDKLWLFLSHSWDHAHHRDGLTDLIESRWLKGAQWFDLAVPRHHPLHCGNTAEVAKRLAERIQACDVLIAFAGLYSSHSAWIEFEVKTAVSLGKPIIAVRPRGQERLSQVVTLNAHREVGWNGRSVRAAVLELLPSYRLRQISANIQSREAMLDLAEMLGGRS